MMELFSVEQLQSALTKIWNSIPLSTKQNDEKAVEAKIEAVEQMLVGKIIADLPASV